MAVIASAELDLNVVNDSYTVSFSNAVCAIHADYDGSNPDLTNAVTTITVARGDVSAAFTLEVTATSSSAVTYTVTPNSDNTQYVVTLTGISTTDLEGYIEMKLVVEEYWTTVVTWSYTVIRETTMLDWILDWETNKTVLGDSYVITPKLYVGKKIESVAEDGTVQDALTGIYIGPDSQFGNSAGIYGYKEGQEIFHLNESGGLIGGWEIENGGIQTSDGTLKILAEGTIEAIDSDQNILWAIYKSGEATFAKGNVTFSADGSASFKGSITSSDGTIGGWTILDTVLYNSKVGLDAAHNAIAVIGGSLAYDTSGSTSIPNYLSSIRYSGGVAMYYTSASAYGLIGYSATSSGIAKAFSLGSQNTIAGWTFDDVALWIGDTKTNTTGAYTEDGITIGTNGIRGPHFYLDSTGAASFADGNFAIASDGTATFVGWGIGTNRLSTAYAALVADSTIGGLFMSSTNLDSIASADLPAAIQTLGGIYMMQSTDEACIAAYDVNKTLLFRLSNINENKIAGWYFNSTALYSGDIVDKAGEYTSKASYITLGANGIRGYQWRLEADGSGAVGGGGVEWDAAGNVTLSDKVTLSASSITSGTIDATNISADVILSNGEAWALNKDGSGYLANGKISWDENGDLEVTEITAITGSIAGFTIHDGYIGIEASANGTGTASNWANLTISSDFFKVGGSDGYVLFGNNVFPSTASNLRTAGRIVNQAGQITGLTTTNFGLYINVANADKNYGVYSNATMMAPAFINTKATLLTFDSSGSYSVDFAANNIILMYSASAVTITMPTESQIKSQFGLSTMDEDFATLLIFKVRTGSATITLTGLYDCDGNSTNIAMYQGDAMTVLITNCDGFQYQIISRYD